jgi:PAS domain S-box-containing protein
MSVAVAEGVMILACHFGQGSAPPVRERHMRAHDPVNILVVDNQPSSLPSYAAILNELSENLIKAQSAKEAVERNLETEIAVVLMDVCKPEFDGFHPVAIIREHPRFETIPILLITAFDLTDRDLARDFEVGPMDYIKAPVARQLLLAKVKLYADLYRKTRQLRQVETELEQRAAAIADVTDRKAAIAKLAQLATIVESSDDAIISKTLEGRVTSWNKGAERVFGYQANEMIGQPITRIIPPELHGEEELILARLRRGERIHHYETPRVTKDGRRIDISLTVSPLRDEAGKVIGASKVARDITERKRAEEHVRFLMRELSHRTKNLMAVVQAISWQTAKRSHDIEDFQQRLNARIEALGRSHNLLVERDWRGVALADLVHSQLEPFLDLASDRLTANGPALLLTPKAAQDLGLALHELATNASKFGALSVATGKIEVTWTVDRGGAGTPSFIMTWRETGGPPIGPPIRKGFGSTAITSALSSSYKGKARLDYPSEGLLWEFVAPTGQLLRELP